MSLKIYTVKKGKHDFSPKEFRSLYRLKNVGAFEYEVVFDASCDYLIPGEDQGDFNKGGGVSFDWYTNTKNAAMWAWRNTPSVSGIELAAYFHKDGKTVIGDEFGIVAMVCNFGERVKIQVWRAFKSWRVTFVKLDVDGNGIEYAEQQLDFGKAHELGYRVGLWFGGNQPAPQKMQVWVDYNVSR